jgi:hypothetical protein
MSYKQVIGLDGKTPLPNVIVRISDGAFIPFDPANTDYQQYLKWLAEGNEPLPPDEETN